MTDCHIQTAAGWYIHQHLYIEGAYSFHNGQFFFSKLHLLTKKNKTKKIEARRFRTTIFYGPVTFYPTRSSPYNYNEPSLIRKEIA